MTRDPGPGPTDSPFSRPLVVAEVPEAGLEISIVANEQERAALAEIDGLVALTRLEADLRVAREGAGGARVTGGLRAELRQTCVVSLEEFDARVVEAIDVRFAPEREIERLSADERRGNERRHASTKAREAKASHHEAILDEDAPDPLVDGRIDLGAIVAEFLALGLDPYPRKPGARFAESDDLQSGEAASPFAGLRQALEKRRRS
jgi:hypothetical protein